jgi:hypothetical protein
MSFSADSVPAEKEQEEIEHAHEAADENDIDPLDRTNLNQEEEIHFTMDSLHSLDSLRMAEQGLTIIHTEPANRSVNSSSAGRSDQVSGKKSAGGESGVGDSSELLVLSQDRVFEHELSDPRPIDVVEIHAGNAIARIVRPSELDERDDSTVPLDLFGRKKSHNRNMVT